MGRNRSVGLTYFPFQVDFFSDIKIRKLIKYQGGKAVTVYALLLCTIYKQGYYMRWDEELPFVISESTGFEEAYIKEVLKCCMVVGLISDDMFRKYKILTSHGIQSQYIKICKDCRRLYDIDEYNLINYEEKGISSEEINISSEEKGISSEEKGINSVKSTQSKVKKRKDISTDVDIQKSSPTSTPPFSGNMGSEIDEMKSSQLWLEQMQMRYHIKSTTDLIRWLDEFKLDCECRSTIHRDISDAKKHFCDWLRIQIEKSKSNGNNRSSYTSKQEANEYAMQQLITEFKQLDEGISDGIPNPF